MSWAETFNGNNAGIRLSGQMKNIKLDGNISQAEIDAKIKKHFNVQDDNKTQTGENVQSANDPQNAQNVQAQNTEQIQPKPVYADSFSRNETAAYAPSANLTTYSNPNPVSSYNIQQGQYQNYSMQANSPQVLNYTANTAQGAYQAPMASYQTGYYQTPLNYPSISQTGYQSVMAQDAYGKQVSSNTAGQTQAQNTVYSEPTAATNPIKGQTGTQAA